MSELTTEKMKDKSTTECPACQGSGNYYGRFDEDDDYLECDDCEGEGRIPAPELLKQEIAQCERALMRVQKFLAIEAQLSDGEPGPLAFMFPMQETIEDYNYIATHLQGILAELRRGLKGGTK